MNKLTWCRWQQETAQALYERTQDAAWRVVAEIFGELYMRLLSTPAAPVVR